MLIFLLKHRSRRGFSDLLNGINNIMANPERIIMSEKSIAVIGCGYWGKNLVRNFSDLGVLNTICDVSSQVLNTLSQKFESVKTTKSVNDVFSDTSIDAVAIAAPAAKHYELARSALNAGKDVFVEKPLALKENEGRELIELAKSKNRILMVGHILHYHPAIRVLKKLLREGALGRIQYIYSNRLNFGKIRREENILWSFAPHDISVIRCLLGEEPIEVSATGSNYLHPDISDVTVSQMKFPGGVNAHIFVSWLHPFKEQKLVVVGDKQMAVFDDTAPWESKLILYPHEVVWKNGIPEAKRAEGENVQLEQAEPLKEECRHFVECVSERSDPISGGTEGLEVLRVLNALQQSLDRNGTPVSLFNEQCDYYAHETAVVEEGAEIGKGTKIWHFAHVMPGASVGGGCSLGQNVVVMPGSKLGNNVKVQNNVSVYEKVVCEDDVFLGPSMVFTNVFNPRSHISRKKEYMPTIVRRGATIGANATIVCGNEIGEYAFVGSGAVVTNGIPAYALVCGNPAKLTGWMCQCGVKLNLGLDDGAEETACDSCGTSYVREGNRVNRK
jgi:UDP-2-acetamido-3-amino-2,3-dideoxy-glucuronate N-acetyltransferase